ncbi:MAG: glycosyltransferase family 2 protein [Proteobacteria bacterium]|nr:glycosyltransferase family 2 protein [Pseudomonadota bacterium]MDA1299369.1 glycosyltransferase family 2 protein [Pseudomonadota bacterium]
MRLSLVIPCYNEAASLPGLLARCDEVTGAMDAEVIIVDNGSTDDTSAVLDRLLPEHPGCRLVRVVENRGYGHGIKAGLGAARGEILGWTHADLQTDPADVITGCHLFETHGENIFVKGRRYGRPPGDVVFTVGMSLFETILLLTPLWDINAQPNLFPRRFYESLEDPPDDFSLDLFFYCLAKRSGLAVHRFPVLFADRAHGESHWNVDWRGKWRFISRTVSFSFRLRQRL